MNELIDIAMAKVMEKIRKKCFSYSFKDILGIDFLIISMYFAEGSTNDILVDVFDFVDINTPNTIQFFVTTYKEKLKDINRKDVLDKLCNILYTLMSKYSTSVESIKIVSIENESYEYFQVTYFTEESCFFCNKTFRLFNVIENIACGIDKGRYGYPVPLPDDIPVEYKCGIKDIKEDK